MIRKALTGAAALLVLFHVWLLAGQWWDGQLADAGLLLRWLAAGGLTTALIQLRRRGTSVFAGRKAVAIWLLAALLHAPAIAHRAGVSGTPDLPEVVATLTLVSAATTVGLGLFLLLVLTSSRRPVPVRRLRAIPAVSAWAGAMASDALVLFAPRPPPVT